jgi:hypothetical protein
MLRIPLIATCLLSLASGLAGQTLTPAPEPSSASAAAVLPPPVSAWEHTELGRTSLGWRDNVLLSPFAPISRAFGRAEVEAFAYRKRNDWQLLAFVNGDVLRYFSPPPETAGEQQWFGHGEVRWQHWPAWRAALKADAFRQDAVIDLSETEAVRTIAPTRVQGAFATAATRITLRAGLTFEPLVQVKRTDYREFPGDYDETKTGARLEWKRGDAFGLSAAWFQHRRAYTERAHFTAGGRELAGTRLHFWQRTAEIKATTGWSLGGRWDAAVTAGRLENRDRSSGFFDYDQKRARLELTWQRARWKIALDGEAKRLDYLGQTVGAGTAPPARMAENFETSVHVDREITDAWTLFAQHRWERNRANESGFSYRANTVLAGVQRTF